MEWLRLRRRRAAADKLISLPYYEAPVGGGGDPARLVCAARLVHIKSAATSPVRVACPPSSPCTIRSIPNARCGDRTLCGFLVNRARPRCGSVCVCGGGADKLRALTLLPCVNALIAGRDSNVKPLGRLQMNRDGFTN